MCEKWDGVWPKDEGSLVEREVEFYQKRKETQLKEGRGCGKGVPARGLEGGNELPAYPNLGV